MSLTRAAGRTMLASFFVVNGAKAAANPTPLVQDAEPIARKVVPMAQRVAPPSVANYIPEDTKQLVRLSGVAQVLGGLGLATGLGRRPSAALLSASMVPHVLAARPNKNMSGEARTAARSVMLRNVALLGATLIAAQDTQGKPSLGYRASAQARAVKKDAKQQAKAIEKTANKQTKQLNKKTSSLQKQAKSQVSQLTDQIESVLS